jgi:hypothetical protein
MAIDRNTMQHTGIKTELKIAQRRAPLHPLAMSAKIARH